MKPENIEFLEAQRHHHDTLVKAFYLRSLSAEVRERLQNIIREEFNPGYITDLWCPPCVSDMVLLVYRMYDEWKASQPPPEPVMEPEPLKEPVRATFPSHKKNHRRK